MTTENNDLRNSFSIGVIGGHLAAFGGEPLIRTRQSEVSQDICSEQRSVDKWLQRKEIGAAVVGPSKTDTERFVMP